LFTIAGVGPQTKVVARRVTLGQRQDGQVEVLSGISPGDRLVTRSSKALKDGDPVRLSAISEGARNTQSGRSQADNPSRSRNNAQ
jgi:HlyD family secretion protein